MMSKTFEDRSSSHSPEERLNEGDAAIRELFAPSFGRRRRRPSLFRHSPGGVPSIDRAPMAFCLFCSLLNEAACQVSWDDGLLAS